MASEYAPLTKISGYLEKKGRKKMMSCYKKYWFVLEGRLLLYYKSKDEYEAISPCKGSITLGATCNIKPCTSNVGVFQIENKTTTITLRAESREEQHRWMHAIMASLNQGNSGTRLCHFRYSLGELSPELTEDFEDQTTLSKRYSCSDPNEARLVEKLQRHGAQTYGIEAKCLQLPNLTNQRRMSFSHETLSLKAKYKQNKNYIKSDSQMNSKDVTDKLILNGRKRAGSFGSWESVSDAIYERIQSNDSVFLKSDKDDKPTDEVLVQNAYYSNSENQSNDQSEIREKWKSTGDSTRSVMTENDYYWSGDQQIHDKHFKDSSTNIDCNDNTIKAEHHRSSLSNISSKDTENVYYEADQYRDMGKESSSTEYADITYTEIDHGGKSEGKKKHRFSSFYKKDKNAKGKTDHKIKKTESFLQRVWAKNKKKKNSKDIYVNQECAVNKIELNDTTTVQMITALQEILETKKMALKEKLHFEPTLDRCKDQEMIYQEVDSQKPNTTKITSSDDETLCPILPPRNHKQKHLSSQPNASENHPNNNSPKFRSEEFTSIDDILNDLNKESQTQSAELDNIEGEGKVKKLIKRFSMGKDDAVQIRVKKNWDLRDGKRETSSTDSGELNKLLDELAKVTTAPIMAPGVTTSLINPEIVDSELMNIIPIRRRRLSDPDYDVPRPHRSLTNVQKKDENALQATRFFGPILNASDFDTKKRPPTPPVDYSNVPSMTPDSLEVTCRRQMLNQEDHNSYQSHNYLNYQKRSHNRIDFIVENNLYDDPRLLCKTKQELGFMDSQIRKHNFNQAIENDFIDSLET